MIKVIKRDGTLVEFKTEKIENAIIAAYTDVYKKYSKPALDQTIHDVLDIVMDKIKQFPDITEDENGLKGFIRVENIQKIVIQSLCIQDATVARAYYDYKSQKDVERVEFKKLVTSVKGILNNTNNEVCLENSNKTATLASTQRDLIAGEISKTMARTFMIPKNLMKAHDEGIIKIHDLDYFMQGIYNCELVNLEDMLQNGTVINKKKIRKPKSLRTAMTLATQIAAQVASSTYGGQTMSISHIAPFVRVSREKIEKKYRNMNIPHDGFESEEAYEKFINKLVDDELRTEIKDSVQTFNYQISTIMTTNGQAPFITLCMYLNENPEYIKETAMLCEEFFKQRIAGIENEYGVVATQTFPKILYFADENNTYEGSEYFWLTKLAAKSMSLRMSPEIISVKKMKEIFKEYRLLLAFPSMGCRAFLSPFKDANGNWKFYGRGNLGVCTVCLPYAALIANETLGKDASEDDRIELFFKKLDEYMNLARDVGELRYEKLRGVKANIAPILWQHGAISRLKPDDDILKAVDENGFTVTIGYSGIYETVKALTGLSHTSEKGYALALRIMEFMEDHVNKFKEEKPHLRFALYGTPSESTTGWFNDKLKARFGEIEDITSKGWITNSYHIDIRENIDAFTKLRLESKLQDHSKGGAISYVEVHNMSKNVPAVIKLIQYMYETTMYGEINFESDVCGKCHYQGVMDFDKERMLWVCPQCGCSDQNYLSVVRRVCGYLGETFWTPGRLLDITNRVKHL